jgi:hypothetical protein
MAVVTIAAVIAVAAPLGMAHALDPDHVLALSGLSVRKSARPGARSLAYAAQWALGHGALLLLVTAAAVLFHVRLPAPVPFWAERLVGVILIATGLSVCWRLCRERLGDGARRGPGGHTHPSTPFAIGVVHGLAGSGAALALIPASLLQPLLGFVYILVFSIGVFAGMVGFGIGLRAFQGVLADRTPRLAQASRGALGVLTAGLGVAWLAGT